MDQNTRNDPYWNRCVFLGASGVFESNTTEEICEGNGDHPTPAAQQFRRPIQRDFETEPSRKNSNHRSESDCEQRRRRPVYEELDPQFHTASERRDWKSSRTSRYQAELESYLKETYGKRG
jgi:hypothetical protein